MIRGNIVASLSGRGLSTKLKGVQEIVQEVYRWEGKVASLMNRHRGEMNG